MTTRTLVKLLVAFTLLMSSYFTFTANATETKTLIEEADFAALSKQMNQENKGLMLMLHAKGCSYCERLEEDLIRPMAISGEYDDRYIIRKFRIDSGVPVVDFSGQKIDPETLGRRYDGQLTPTLVFLDANGKERAEKIIGYNVPSLFGGYVENQLEIMRKSLIKNAN